MSLQRDNLKYYTLKFQLRVVVQQIGSVSVKVDQAIPFLTTHAKNGWVNLDVKVARSGNPYIELYQPKAKVESTKPVAEPVAESSEDLPF